MMSDDVGDDRTDDVTECDGNNVESRESDWENVKVMIIAAVKWRC
jgi:uncharacterized protein involved in tellurium resistance